MLNRVWTNNNFTSRQKPKVEEHIHSDGSYRYLLRGVNGKSCGLAGADEAKAVIIQFQMVEATE